MTKRMMIGLVLTIIAQLPNSAQPSRQKVSDTKTLEQEVACAEEQRREAILRNDIPALDRLIAPEFTSSLNLLGGKVGTKADELNFNESGTRKIQSWEHSDVKIRIYGDVGLVTGLAEVIDSLKGDRRHIRFRYTHVWVKQTGRWQLVHRHTTRVATLEGPTPPR
jgi:hypothetical protein